MTPPIAFASIQALSLEKRCGPTKVALVHDWFFGYAGSERVVEQILNVFPQADVFSVVDHLAPEDRHFLKNKTVQTSFLQNLPFSKQIFRKFLWLHPIAVESLDVSAYDLVISSSHAVAKGVLTGPHQLHICYCHTPIRYAWDLQHEYLRQAGLTRGLSSVYARVALHYLRLWDQRTAHGVDHFIANSSFIANRIAKVYRRQATVIHPPVDTDAFSLETEKEDFYLTASRLVPYKRVDLIVKAFAQMPDRKLVIVGDGPEMRACKSFATPNIEIRGHESAATLRMLMGKAKAFVFAAEEDFGINVVEAQASGTPVLCFGRGGVLDSVIPGRTGLFFRERTPEGIAACVDQFESSVFDPVEIRAHALQFSRAEFRRKLAEFVSSKCVVHDFIDLELNARKTDKTTVVPLAL